MTSWSTSSRMRPRSNACAGSYGRTSRSSSGRCSIRHTDGAAPFLLPALVLLAACQAADGALDERPPYVPRGYRLLYEHDFERPATLQDAGFTFSDVEAWRLGKDADNTVLVLHGQSRYRPPVRSPRALALIAGKAFGDFVLEADLKQTGREYGHRDLCLFFGVEAPDRYYYVHLSSTADDHAHNVFLVKEQPRVKFAERTTAGVDWGRDRWHRVRIVRAASSGRIAVYFDDMAVPIMRARDRSFAWGQIGFGSFDDAGMFDNIRIWGPASRPTPGIRFR